MANFITVAKKSEILSGKGKAYPVEGKTVAVFNVGGNFYAMDNSCPHRGASLAEGLCQDAVVVCPWHGFRFDMKTGENPEGMPYQVKCYPVRLEGDEVQVEIG